MSEINNEHQSAPSGAQTSELEQEANRPLGVASCSDSSFWRSICESVCDLFQMRERYVWRGGKWNHELYLPDVTNRKNK